MTKAEAIRWTLLIQQSEPWQERVIEALDMAIEALEREPSEDLISRAEAIEALGEEPPVWCDEEYEIAERNQWRADIEAIKSVPPANRPRGE